jgi:hypothetical protein
MDRGLPADAEPLGREVGVEVAGEEAGLEEHHAGVPHRRRAAQLGQDHLGDHELDDEQQRGADEQGKRVEERQGWISGEGCRRAEFLLPSILLR